MATIPLFGVGVGLHGHPGAENGDRGHLTKGCSPPPVVRMDDHGAACGQQLRPRCCDRDRPATLEWELNPRELRRHRLVPDVCLPAGRLAIYTIETRVLAAVEEPLL